MKWLNKKLNEAVELFIMLVIFIAFLQWRLVGFQPNLSEATMVGRIFAAFKLGLITLVLDAIVITAIFSIVRWTLGW